MRWFARLRFLLSALLRRRALDAELDEELRHHLALRAERNLAGGMDAASAAAEAQRQFGRVERIREDCRTERGLAGVDHAWLDLRTAFRSLRQSPGFALVAVLTLAVGIGASCAIFSVVEAVLLRPFPFRHQQELVWIHASIPTRARASFSLPEFCDYRDRVRSFTGLAAVSPYNTNLSDRTGAERVQGIRISANGMALLGSTPAAGRNFVAADDAPSAPRVAMLGYALWQTRYAGDPGIVGRSIVLNGQPHDVVGILPRGFALPGFDVEAAVPLRPDADPLRHERNSVNFLKLLGRLRPGVTLAQAHAELDTIRANLRRDFPVAYSRKIGVMAVPLGDEIVGNSRPMLLTLFGAVGALLLIASANLAGMLLVRAMARYHEFAVRAALGAKRSRLIRLLLAESLILAVAAGLVGTLLALASLHTLLAFAPVNLPRGNDVGIDGTVLGFALGLSLLTGAVFGLVPAWLLSKVSPHDALRGSRAVTSSPASQSLRRALVVVQISVALALLTVAGLFLKSFWQLTREPLGFDPSHVLTVRLSLAQPSYPDRATFTEFTRKMCSRLDALPGVESSALVSLLPLSGHVTTVDFTVADRPPPATKDIPTAQFRVISPDYLATLKIPLLSGRDFTDADTADQPTVALVNEELARKFFPDRDPLGRAILIDDNNTAPRPAIVVGVVGNVKQLTFESPRTFDVYIPARQMVEESVPWLRNNSACVLRTAGDPRLFEPAVREQLNAIDPGVPTNRVQALSDFVAGALAARRFSLVVIGLFAASALFLSATGLYAIIGYTVSRRAREFGVRLAVGARPVDILFLVMGEGLRLAAVGSAIGLVLALVAAQVFSSQLYQVTPHDPGTLAAVVGLVAVLAVLASWLPARRATRVDPLVALRSE